MSINQKGIAHILVLVLLLVGLGVGVYLVQHQTNLLPKASGEKTTSFRCSVADFNNDGKVNLFDLIRLGSQFNQKVTDTNRKYDLNGDGKIDDKDRQIFGYCNNKTAKDNVNVSASLFASASTPSSCLARPACLDANPPCQLMPPNEGWCPKSYQRVFVTSTTYDGNLGGLAGADAKCQARADAVNLGGTWKAWLSDSTTSAASRLNHSTVPYKLLNGTVVANNWRDLTKGSIQNAITITEQQTTFAPWYITHVWTGTSSSGAITNYAPALSSQSCQNWTNTTAHTYFNIGGVAGDNTYSDNVWSEIAWYDCNNSSRLYCFEQPPLPSPTSTPTPTPSPTPTPTPTPSPTPTPLPKISLNSPANESVFASKGGNVTLKWYPITGCDCAYHVSVWDNKGGYENALTFDTFHSFALPSGNWFWSVVAYIVYDRDESTSDTWKFTLWNTTF